MSDQCRPARTSPASDQRRRDYRRAKGSTRPLLIAILPQELSSDTMSTHARYVVLRFGIFESEATFLRELSVKIAGARGRWTSVNPTECRRKKSQNGSPPVSGGVDMSEEWDCKACPVASDLLKWLDELSAQNAGLKARNASLRKKLAGGR
jgi:hypothetical protein